MTRSKREPLKWNFCSLSQKFCMFHSAAFRNSVLFKLFAVEKRGTVTIFNHFSLSEIRLWKLAQARCYQPVSLFKGFHHQDFSMIAVDTQEWNWGSWGCGWGRMYRKVWHCAGRVVFVHKFVVYWIYCPREWDVYNLTIYHLPSTSPLWESTNFLKIQVYQVSHVDVHQVPGRIQILMYWRGKWWNFMTYPWIHEHGIL